MPGISQDTVIEVAGMGINLLVMLGIVIDPTTSDASDSARALSYDEPNKEK